MHRVRSSECNNLPVLGGEPVISGIQGEWKSSNAVDSEVSIHSVSHLHLVRVAFLSEARQSSHDMATQP
jgi:hypothetical protein